MAEQIERLKAQSKPTRAVVEDELWTLIDGMWDYGLIPSRIARRVCDHLVSKGMVEDTPKAAEPVSPTTFIGGVRTDTMKRIPTAAEMKGILKKDDPLKVDVETWDSSSWKWQSMAEKHNAFVDLVRAHLGKEAE
jgi:hypothetical protein